MSTAITGIDHTLVGVADLEAAHHAYSRLGFTITPRGSHIGWGTANYCIMFPHDYIELIGIVDASQFTNNLDTFLETGEGLMAVAFGSEDIATTRGRLAAHRIDAEARDLKRNLELPEGTVQPAFELLLPDPAALAGLPAFFVRHLTPELIRRPDWLDHPNRAQALASVTALVDDPPALVEAFERVFGAGQVTTTDDVMTVHAGPHRVHFTRPAELPDLHPEASEADGKRPLPRLAVMSVVTADPDATARHLAGTGVSFSRAADGTLTVAPADACGLWLEFVTH